MGSFDKDGGPAFPASVEDKRDGDGYAGKQTGPHSGIDTGMTLRDYFAAKAMQGILAGPCSREGVPVEEWFDVPEQAYKIADVMLDERSKEIDQ